jgi:hypothetical protein
VQSQAAIEAAQNMEAVQKNLDAAKTLRAAQKRTTYTVTQRRSCNCLPDATRPIRYAVVNNVITTGAQYADTDG